MKGQDIWWFNLGLNKQACVDFHESIPINFGENSNIFLQYSIILMIVNFLLQRFVYMVFNFGKLNYLSMLVGDTTRGM